MVDQHQHQRTGTTPPTCDEAAESGGESRATTLLTAVERSVLRALAFVFYQLERTHAKRLARAVLRWYLRLQLQLPAYAVASLERVAASVVELADAQFSSFWLSLLEKEIDDAAEDADDAGSLPGSSYSISSDSGDTFEARVTIQICTEPPLPEAAIGDRELLEAREKTLAKRLYQHIYGGIRSLFFATRSRATQTPCTSPVDLSDESHYRPSRHRRSFAAGDDDDDGSARDGDDAAAAASLHTSAAESEQLLEPGWAVEYMEQESPVAAELALRMRRMMHSSVPLNLFRVAVAYSAPPCGGGDGNDEFLGGVTPESFAPTPVTRDLQTRRLHCYTASVLDHATLALRLLEASSRGSSSSLCLR